MASRDEDGSEAPSLGARRAIALVATLGLLAPTFTAWNDIVSVPLSGIGVVALFAGLLWLGGAVAMARTEAQLARLEVWLLGLGLLALAAWSATKLQAQGGYGTDEAALEQGAATLLLHGHDPYGANLYTALAGFSIPTRFATHTMSGAIVSTFGYPAFPLLVVAPFIELTAGGQAVPIADICVLMIATVVMFRQLPGGLRSLAVILGAAFPILSGFAVAGVNSVIAMALLLVPAFRWTSTGESGTLVRRDVLAALALGVALATNQLAWFIAPFLIAGILLIRRSDLGARAAAAMVVRYVGLAAAAFVVINAPFFVWGPSAWLHGVAAPLTEHATPYGQGLVDLTLFLRIGGGALDAYDYAAVLLYLALLIVYVARFRTVGRLCFVLPLAALFVSGRSLAEYWMTLIAVIAVGSLTADQDVISSVRPPRGLGHLSRARERVALLALFLPAAACLVLALATPQPLAIHIISARSNAALRSVQELRLSVQNRSDEALRPHFATNADGQSVFWNVRSGPRALAPHAAAVYELTAPDDSATVPNGTPFVVEAVTPSPRTISSTSSFSQTGPTPGYW
jgi:uncharacterized membrane protein